MEIKRQIVIRKQCKAWVGVTPKGRLMVNETISPTKRECYDAMIYELGVYPNQTVDEVMKATGHTVRRVTITLDGE